MHETTAPGTLEDVQERHNAGCQHEDASQVHESSARENGPALVILTVALRVGVVQLVFWVWAVEKIVRIER